MRGYRIVGLLALAAASVQAPDAAAQYAFSLIDVPGSTATSAHDINAAGHIVGNFKDASGLSKPYLLRGGVFTVLDLPGSTFGNGNAINSVGQIAGRWDDAAGVTHGFLWESGVLTMIDAQGVGATKTNVMAINDKGQMAGKYWDQNGIAHGCVLDRTGAVLWNDFDVPGAISTEPKGINEAGDLVGTYALPDGTMYGFRKLRGGALEYPWGYPGTGSPLPQTVEDIDDAGAIVVNYFDGQHRGALLKDGAWTLVDVPGAVDTSLDAFSGPNGTGVFVGTCYLNGVHHGFKTITPKFLTADDVLATGGDAVYQYDGSGLGAVPQPLYSYNSATRGMTRNAAGTQYWTINADRMVYVYDANFQPVDFWAANGLPTACQVGGIATAGNDVWVLDAKSLKVLKFTNGALDTNGDKSASGSFKLAAANSKPKDIVTDGTYFWVLDDAATDKVYKYTMTGTFVSSFTLSTAGATAPRAIAIDPANPNDLWIVDGGTKRVYKYANAVNAANSSSQTAASSFPLAAGNTNPQGLILKP